MTATSLRNALPFRNALRVVSQNKKMTIVTCILYLLGIPLAMTAVMLELIGTSHRQEQDTLWKIADNANFEIYIGIGCMLLGIAVFMGMFTAIHSFTETHKKTKVDMLYALPLTGTQRFFSNYIGGCMMYILPYLVSCLLGWGILLGASPFVKWNTALGFDSFGTFMSEVGSTFALGMLGLLILMLLYYTLSVLVTVCCGTLFESIYTNILLNGLIPGTVAIIIGVVSAKLDLDFEYSWHSIGFMSPIGGLIYLIMLLSGELNDTIYESAYRFVASQTVSHDMIPNYLRWFFAILLLTAVLLVGAWLLYKRRKAEEVGKPFVYVLAYYLMLTLGTVAILCMAVIEDDLIGAALLISAVAYFIMEVIRKRGFKKFWLSIITYIATAVLTFGCFALLITTKCFGRMNYVPAAIGVSSVRLEFNDDRRINTDYSYSLEYTDRDIISEVTKIHRDVLNDRLNQTAKNAHYDSVKSEQLNQEMLDERWENLFYEGNAGNYYGTGYFPTYSSDIPCRTENGDPVASGASIPDGAVGEYTNGYRFSLTYFTLTGSAIHRTYNLTADEMYRMLNIVRGTKLYAQAMHKGMDARLEQEYASYDDKGRRSRIPQNVQFNITNLAEDRGDAVTNRHMAYLDGAPGKLAQLTAAYETDLANMTAEDFCTAKVFCYVSQMPVYTTCTESVALLQSWGLEGFNVPERYAFSDKQNDFSNFMGGMGMRIYKPSANRAASYDYPHSTAAPMYVKGEPAYADGIYCSNETNLQKTYPELWALLDAARPYYVTNEDCYVLYFGSDCYLIPAADAKLAEAVIAKGSGYGWKKTHKAASDLGWTTTAGGFDDFTAPDDALFNENSAPDPADSFADSSFAPAA